MDPTLIGILGLVLFLVLLVLGVHVGVAMFAAGAVGAIAILGFQGGLMQLGTAPYRVGSTYGYAAVPLFLLMGSFTVYGEIAEDAYRALYTWVSRLPGSLAVATTLACGAFGAASGSSVASAAIFTKASLPEMIKYKYDTSLAVGCVAAAGTFATMIPPSILLILYGIFTETSIAKLFLAGILPGLFTVVVYAASIVFRAWRNPKLAPVAKERVFSWKDRVSSFPMMWPIALLVTIVIGGIYLGWFTPTEAGAAGSVAALAIVLVRKGPRGSHLGSVLRDTAHTTAQIFVIIIGAIVLSRFLAVSQIPTELASLLEGLPVPRVVILTGFLIMYFFLGMVVSATGMLAITLPIVAPILAGLGYDLIWFGIIAIKMCEIAVVTPPVGLNCYIVKGVAGKQATLEQVFAGIWPFIICDFVVLIFLIAFPQIALLLPNLTG